MDMLRRLQDSDEAGLGLEETGQESEEPDLASVLEGLDLGKTVRTIRS